MTRTHTLLPGLTGRTSATARHSALRILLIGCGGNGSAVLLQLPYLHQALLAWGHPGLDVTVFDRDSVSESNCVRQPYSQVDVGLNKATVLVSRLNSFWGLQWSAQPRHFDIEDSQYLTNADLVISCVDTRTGRKQIYQMLRNRLYGSEYWLDLGNSSTSGQFVLGTVPNRNQRRVRNGLPSVVDLFPDIADDSLPEDDLPSCSAIEALQRQEPFINQTLAVEALAMLTRLLRYGSIRYHGGKFNAEVGSTIPLRIDSDEWAKQRKHNKRAAACRQTHAA